jgi:hypothetical protein
MERKKPLQIYIDAGGVEVESNVIRTITHVQQTSRRIDAAFKRNTLYLLRLV